MDGEIELEHRLTAVEKLAGSNRHRLDEVEKKQGDQDKLIATIALIAQKQEHMESDVNEIRSDLKTLLEKPGKRWEAIVEKVIWVLLAAAIGYFLSKAGIQ